MKGIILAGGSGTRLFPLTQLVSKQLLPIYDKPMICYPLSTLMLLGITEILIISTPRDTPIIESFLKNGEELGISISYAVQQKPNGVADAFLIAEDFIDGQEVCLILGDNIFNFVSNPSDIRPKAGFKGAQLVAYHVSDPERFGVLEITKHKEVVSIEEKPKKPKSNFAAVGLYFYDSSVSQIAKKLERSSRGELEITDLNNEYLNRKALSCCILPRGSIWVDAGTVQSLISVSNYIKSVEDLQKLKVSCVEEVALRQNYIGIEEFKVILSKFPKSSPYYNYLEKIQHEFDASK
jgi:glucose-1-phosphate thymidylyltransferase